MMIVALTFDVELERNVRTILEIETSVWFLVVEVMIRLLLISSEASAGTVASTISCIRSSVILRSSIASPAPFWCRTARVVD
jgi:hypothetical protein